MWLPCFRAADRERSFPPLVFGPLDVPPCIWQVVLPRTAHLRHRFFDLLLFAVHWATMIQGVQFSNFSRDPSLVGGEERFWVTTVCPSL